MKKEVRFVVVFFVAMFILFIGARLLNEERIYAEMKKHPLGTVGEAYEEYEVLPLGRYLCFLIQGDDIIVADLPGNGSGNYYERIEPWMNGSGNVPIGVSKSYIIMREKNGRLIVVRHTRTNKGNIIMNVASYIKFERLPRDEQVFLTP